MIRSFLVKIFLIVSAMFLPISAANSQQLQNWMHPEVAAAWKKGWKGQGTSITVFDDFSSDDHMSGNITGKSFGGYEHGFWVAGMAHLIAPSSKLHVVDVWGDSEPSWKIRRGLNVFNFSIGIMGDAGIKNFPWTNAEKSGLKLARQGKFIVVKAAGNDSGIGIGQKDRNNNIDYLNRDLIGGKSVIFVGALDKHGTKSSKARLADYSNIAGKNKTVQNQFLVVGVRGNLTDLYGTSFAAPIVSGYAAILGSKFNKANPTQITNQLLRTARTDTIKGYKRHLHGRGEASLTRALAPKKIK